MKRHEVMKYYTIKEIEALAREQDWTVKKLCGDTVIKVEKDGDFITIFISSLDSNNNLYISGIENLLDT
jgi:hypothetical protein